MIDIPAGGFWAMATVFGVIVLGAVIAWGMMRNASRDRRRDALTEAGARQVYEHPEAEPNDASPNPDERLAGLKR